jgi:hypothetical protein
LAKLYYSRFGIQHTISLSSIKRAAKCAYDGIEENEFLPLKIEEDGIILWEKTEMFDDENYGKLLSLTEIVEEE